MKPQEIFDVVSAHLLTQNARAVKGGSNPIDASQCLYRAPGGLKCAAGVLIPDAVYDKEMEGTNISVLIDERGSLPDFMRDNEPLIRALQVVHDFYDPKEWTSQLNAVAARFSLTPLLEEAA